MDSNVLALIVAFIGSSGLVGALTLSVQHSRAVRLRRSIREALELADAIEGNGRAAASLRAAATLDSYRLSAMSLVQYGGFLVSYIVILIAMLVVAGALMYFFVSPIAAPATGAAAFSENPVLTVVGFAIGYILIFVIGFDGLLRIRRDRLVARLVESGAVRLVVHRGLARFEDVDPAESTKQDTPANPVERERGNVVVSSR